MSREAMKLALEALESDPISHAGIVSRKQAITALRQALETEQEPVAWMHNVIEGNVITHIPADIGRHPERWTPLYVAPCQTCVSLAMAVMNDQTYHEKVIPKREWVGLTDDEINSVCYKRDWTAPWTNTTFARAIEAKLREKNHG